MFKLNILQTDYLVAMNKTSNNGNILRRRTRDIKPCTVGQVSAILISRKIYISVDISITALSIG